MSWHQTVGHLGGASVDHGHVDQRLWAARVSVAVGFSPLPARSQRLLGEVAGEAAEVGSVHRLIDGLVHHVPFRVVRELGPQRLADLFRAPLLPQPVLHEAPQHRIPGDFAGPPAGAALHRKTVRRERSISTRFLVSIAPQLPADRRRTAAGPGRDVPHPVPCPAQVGDLDPLVFGKEPRRDLRRGCADHRCIVQRLPAAAGDCAAEAPACPGSAVDADDPAGLRVRHAPCDQLHELFPLLDLWCRTW